LFGLMSVLDTRLGKRKTVNMNEDIAQELNKLANISGKTLYSLINEIGIQAVEANKQGFTLEEAVIAKKLVQSARRSRMVLVNQDLWYFASSEAMKASRNKWLKLLRDSAQWQANVFLNGSNDAEFIESVKSLLADYFWDCGDVRFETGKNGDDLALRLAFVPEMPLEHTQGLFKCFEGMFNVHGYVATDSTVEPGFLAVSFKKIIEGVPAKPQARLPP
jgi:hypothetical protein